MFESVDSECGDGVFVIRDLYSDGPGPWDQHPTITNDAEYVVAMLARTGICNVFRRIFYYDSEGDLAELLTRDGRFVGFGAVSGLQRTRLAERSAARWEAWDENDRVVLTAAGWEATREEEPVGGAL
jgi:hypothetical protein